MIKLNCLSCTLQINETTVISTSSVALIGITIEIKLNFENHIDNIIQKAYYKTCALRRIRKF